MDSLFISGRQAETKCKSDPSPDFISLLYNPSLRLENQKEYLCQVIN